METFIGKDIVKWWGDISDLFGYPIKPDDIYVVDHHSGINGRPEYVTLAGWKNSRDHGHYPRGAEDGKEIEALINFPKTEKIELHLRQDLADRLPKGKCERNAFINLAMEHELEGIKPEWLSRGGKAKSEKKVAAVRENGKKGGRPRKSVESK